MVLVLLSNVSFAQGPEDPGESPDTVDMPLDNGVLLLIMAGIGSAGLKYIEYREKKKRITIA